MSVLNTCNLKLGTFELETELRIMLERRKHLESSYAPKAQQNIPRGEAPGKHPAFVQ